MINEINGKSKLNLTYRCALQLSFMSFQIPSNIKYKVNYNLNKLKNILLSIKQLFQHDVITDMWFTAFINTNFCGQ